MTENSFLKVVKGQVIVKPDVDELHILIPKENLEKGLTEELGLSISTVAIFKMEVIKGKNISKHNCVNPNRITLNFVDRVIDKDVVRYVLYSNDIFCEKLRFMKSASNIEDTVKLILNTSLPDGIPYSELIGLLHQTQLANNASLNTRSVILQLLISEVIRDPNNEEIPFRLTMKDPKSTNYKQIRVNDAAAASDVWGGMTFENLSKATVAGMSKTLRGLTEPKTELEKVVRGMEE